MDNIVGPISPQEVTELQKDPSQIPQEVFQAFNQLIVEGISPLGDTVIVFQDDVLERMKFLGLDPKEVMKKDWLDVEGFYRRVG